MWMMFLGYFDVDLDALQCKSCLVLAGERKSKRHHANKERYTIVSLLRFVYGYITSYPMSYSFINYIRYIYIVIHMYRYIHTYTHIRELHTHPLVERSSTEHGLRISYVRDTSCPTVKWVVTFHDLLCLGFVTMSSATPTLEDLFWKSVETRNCSGTGLWEFDLETAWFGVLARVSHQFTPQHP